MLEIADSDANIHLANQATTKMVPVIMLTEITERLVYGITMESSHITTLRIPGISKQEKQIHISQKLRHPHNIIGYIM